MINLNPEETKPYPWQRIDYLLKQLEFYYPNTYMPFWLVLLRVQFKFKNDLPVEMQLPEQLLPNKPNKLIVDLLQEGEAKFWGSLSWLNVVAFAEYMHSNQSDYIERLDLAHSLFKYKYNCDEVIPLVVYTGHEPCRLAKLLKDRFRKFRCLLMDLTSIDPQITMNHHLFAIKFLTIFSHRLNNRQLADFFIREFDVLRYQVDTEEFYRFAILIQLAITPRNAMAIKEITQHLFNKPVEYYHEILKGTPLYEDLVRYYNEEKIQQEAQFEAEKARFEAEKARAEAAEAQARAEAAEAQARAEAAEAQARAEAAEKARAERIAGAVRIIKQFGLPVEQVVQTLGLTDDEIAAVETALKA
jgi:hypothetical protein